MHLNEINDPSQIKALDLKQLEELAKEIRETLITTISQTGGHLAANLGVVELTLAYHYVYNSPIDRIIWDVGHQSYVHKLLTGRLESFCTIRQLGGLSGFPKYQESPHDCFNTGHSSTSISAALGIALARDLSKEKHHVVAVIGDGALTGGMALEAINHAGHLGTRLIVILNDNEMSIASNVGAMSAYLSRIRSSPKYVRRKKKLVKRIQQVPAVGSGLYKFVARVKGSLKHLLVPGILFEELGFTYLGPVDGHNLNSLITVLGQAKNFNEPVLIHVITKKGKGYLPAEEYPDTFHGISPFDTETGLVSKRSGPLTYTEVFGRSLVELATINEIIIGITAAMLDGTCLKYIAEAFPDRFFDVGIAEQHAVTLAAGLACRGYRPVLAIYSTFLQRAYDQLIHDVCLQNLPVLFAIDRAGLVGEDGETHHGVFDISYLRPIPNLIIMSPKDELELKQMLVTALECPGPVAIRYPRGRGVGMETKGDVEALPVGQAELIEDGEDILIIAVGSMVNEALKASVILKKDGIDCRVINARFIKPLDENLFLGSILKINNVVTIEEQVLAGGFGSAIRELLGKHRLNNVNLLNLGLPDTYVSHGEAGLLREKFGLTAFEIAKTVKKHFS